MYKVTTWDDPPVLYMADSFRFEGRHGERLVLMKGGKRLAVIRSWRTIEKVASFGTARDAFIQATREADLKV